MSEVQPAFEIDRENINRMKLNGHVNSGSSEIDQLMGGGMVSGSFYLLEFEPGTAEMTFIASYLNQGLSQGDFCTLILYERPYDYVVGIFEELGVRVKEALSSGSMVIADLYSTGEYNPDNAGPILLTENPSDPNSALRVYQDLGKISRTKLETGKFKGIRGVQYSLSAQLMVHKFETTYKLTKSAIEVGREDMRVGRPHNHTALCAMNSRMVSQTDVATFEHLHDGVIILTIKEVDGKFQRLLRVKQSPLASFCSDEVPYEIVGNRPSIITSFAYPPPVEVRHSETMILDAISHEIVSELQKDGRKTFEELGKKLGYTGMAVKKRIRNLMNHDIIRVSALLNIAKMDIYAAFTMLELESAEALNHLLDRFRDCPRVINMFTTLGSYNSIVLSVAEDLDTLQSVSLEKCSLRSNEGIRRSDFYPIGNVHYSTYLAVREYLAHRDKDTAPCRSNCRTCKRYQTRKCVGCPATRWYRGKL